MTPTAPPAPAVSRPWFKNLDHWGRVLAVGAILFGLWILWLTRGLEDDAEPFFAVSTYLGVLACGLWARTIANTAFGPASFLVRAIGGLLLAIYALEWHTHEWTPYMVVVFAVLLEALGQLVDHRFPSAGRTSAGAATPGSADV